MLEPDIHLRTDFKHDFVIVVEVNAGNPNGDPDNRGLPRILPGSGHGLISKGSITRQIRDAVNDHYKGQPRMGIYVNNDLALNLKNQDAYAEAGVTLKKHNLRTIADVTSVLTSTYFDIRVLGGVMSTGVNAGTVRAAISINWGQSVDPIEIQVHAITRKALVKEDEMEARVVKGKLKDAKTSMLGSSSLVPFAVYLITGSYDPTAGKLNGVDSRDLKIFWEVLETMWRPNTGITTRATYIFSHQNPMGSLAPRKLQELVKVELKDERQPATKFSDYLITLGELPAKQRELLKDVTELQAGFPLPQIILTKL